MVSRSARPIIGATVRILLLGLLLPLDSFAKRRKAVVTVGVEVGVLTEPLNTIFDIHTLVRF